MSTLPPHPLSSRASHPPRPPRLPRTSASGFMAPSQNPLLSRPDLTFQTKLQSLHELLEGREFGDVRPRPPKRRLRPALRCAMRCYATCGPICPVRSERAQRIRGLGRRSSCDMRWRVILRSHADRSARAGSAQPWAAAAAPRGSPPPPARARLRCAGARFRSVPLCPLDHIRTTYPALSSPCSLPRLPCPASLRARTTPSQSTRPWATRAAPRCWRSAPRGKTRRSTSNACTGALWRFCPRCSPAPPTPRFLSAT